MKMIPLSILVIAACATFFLTGCSSSAPKTSSQVLAEAEAAYQAYTALEVAYGSFCAAQPNTQPCPTTPWPKLAAADNQIYTALQGANTTLASGGSLTFTLIQGGFTAALSALPGGTTPALQAALTAFQTALAQFTADVGTV
jgi:hypothetical protein